MNIFISILSGVVIGIIIGLFLKRSSKKAGKAATTTNSGDIDLPELYEAKAENIVKLKEHLKSAPKISNDEVQSLLKVSDATATRYLDELEKEGLIKQVGKTGQDVYYERLKS